MDEGNVLFHFDGMLVFVYEVLIHVRSVTVATHHVMVTVRAHLTRFLSALAAQYDLKSEKLNTGSIPVDVSSLSLSVSSSHLPPQSFSNKLAHSRMFLQFLNESAKSGDEPGSILSSFSLSLSLSHLPIHAFCSCSVIGC